MLEIIAKISGRVGRYVADIRERLAHYEGGGRHSLASKGRQVKPRGETPLFDPPYDETADAIGSYNDAVRAVGAKVRAGEPLPPFFLSDEPEAARVMPSFTQRDRFPFDHLTLDEVAEAQRLMLMWASTRCDQRALARLAYLNKHRRLPQYILPPQGP